MAGIASRSGRRAVACAALIAVGPGAGGRVAAGELPFEPTGVTAALGAAGTALADLVPGANPALLSDVDRAWATVEMGLDTGERVPQRFGLTLPATERSGFALDFARGTRTGRATETTREEWRLGAGRRFSGALAGGATLRLQRESGADHRDTSHGLDLGVHARRGALAFGAVARNAVRPRIQSNEATWVEPRVLHTAVALSGRVRGVRASAAAGVATSTSTRGEVWGGVHVHGFGPLEVALGASHHSRRLAVGVRAGATHVELAGGRDDGDDWIATALRLHFGASRQERRAAADRHADETFSARLGREIEVRQARQIETWLDEAAQAAHDRDHARAVVLYRNVLLLQADAAAARDGLARAQRALLLARADSLTAAGDPTAATVVLEDIVRQFPEDSLATQRLAVTRKAVRRADRSRNEAAEQLRLGLDAYASQQYATAVRYLESARDRDPGNVTVRELLQQARAAHERQLTATLAQARARLDQGDPDEARRLVESVLAVAPKRPQAVALRTEIERESARLAEKRVAVRASDEVAREDRAPVPPAVLSSGYQQGMQLYRAGDLVAAMRAWEDLARLAPHYADVDQYLLRVYRVCGLERYTEGRLQDAIDIWEKALRLEPNNAQVRRYLNQANAKMKRAHEPRGKQ